MTAQLLKSYPDIGLYILYQVAEMNSTIGIGQSAGYQHVAAIHGRDITCKFNSIASKQFASTLYKLFLLISIGYFRCEHFKQ